MSRIARVLAVLVAVACAAFAPAAAMAASFDDCRTEIEGLDAAFPEGMPDFWVTTLQEELDYVNSLDDEASLQEGQEAVWAEFDAYLADPDPDGDGLSMLPEVMEHDMYVRSCLYTARIVEVRVAADESFGEGGDEFAADVGESLGSPPVPANDGWFASADYPVAAMREGREGVVEYDVTVGADGSVLGCQAQGPAGSADLEIATCDAILANARFDPATDDAGQAITGEYSGSLRWTMSAE